MANIKRGKTFILRLLLYFFQVKINVYTFYKSMYNGKVSVIHWNYWRIILEKGEQRNLRQKNEKFYEQMEQH